MGVLSQGTPTRPGRSVSERWAILEERDRNDALAVDRGSGTLFQLTSNLTRLEKQISTCSDRKRQDMEDNSKRQHGPYDC